MSLLPSSARRWAPIALAVVVLDQLTKWWALNTLDDRNIDLFWTLRFNLSFNNGMAFSQGEGLGPIIGVVALVVIVALVLSLRRENNPLADVAVGLIVGGAVGNVIDRLFRDPGWMRGAVVDFIDFQWFPIFNVADMAITVGGIMLIAVSWWSARQAELAAATDDAQPADADDVRGERAVHDRDADDVPGEPSDAPESRDA